MNGAFRVLITGAASAVAVMAMVPDARAQNEFEIARTSEGTSCGYADAMADISKRITEAVGGSGATEQKDPRKRQQSRERYDAFVRVNGITVWPDSEALVSNPFIYEGKIIGIRVCFTRMMSRTEAIFETVFVSNVPQTRFKVSGQWAILAGRVVGIMEVPTPFGGHVNMPHLRYVASHLCTDVSCDELLYWKPQ